MGEPLCPRDVGGQESRRRGLRAEAMGQDRRLDRLAGSRPGDWAGVSSGGWGAQVSLAAWRVWVTSRLGYAAGDARLGGGVGHRADPGTL